MICPAPREIEKLSRIWERGWRNLWWIDSKNKKNELDKSNNNNNNNTLKVARITKNNKIELKI